MCDGRQLHNLLVNLFPRDQCVETWIQLKKDDLAESAVLTLLNGVSEGYLRERSPGPGHAPAGLFRPARGSRETSSSFR